MTDALPTLSIEHEKFLSVFLQTGNATEAYAQAYPTCKRTTAGTNGRRLLENAAIQAELARKRTDIAAAIDLKQIAIFKRLKAMAFTDITEVMGSPSTWSPEAAQAVQSYDAGGPQSSEKVRLHDQPKLLLELNDRLFPDTAKAKPEADAPSPQKVYVDKLLVDLRSVIHGKPA